MQYTLSSCLESGGHRIQLQRMKKNQNMDHNYILIICLMVTIVSCRPLNREKGRNLAQQVSESEKQFGRYAPEYEKTVDEYETDYQRRYSPEHPLSRVVIAPPILEPVQEEEADNLYREGYPHMFIQEDINYKREGPSSGEMLPELESGGKYMGLLPTRNVDDETIRKLARLYLEDPDVDPRFRQLYPELIPGLQLGETYEGHSDDDMDTVYSHGEDVIENKLKEEDPFSNMIFDIGKQFLKIND